MTDPLPPASKLASFADTVAKTLEARADRLGQPPIADLIRAFAAVLADSSSPGATARLDRELTRLVRLRRAQGHPLDTVLAEIGRLQDAIFDHVVELASAAGPQTRADEVLPLAKRFLGTARGMAETARSLFSQDLNARRQSRAALLGAFARAVTHELRNRVNAARLSLSVVRLSREEQREEPLQLLDESLKQLEDSVRDVSAVALAQARDLPLEQRLQPIADMLADLRDDVRDLTLAGKVELRIAGPLPDVAVDAGKLRLALLSLVSNAIKHADRAKPVRWVEIRIGPGSARGEWRVDVADNGVGLPAIERPIEQSVGGEAGASPSVERQEIGIVLATEAVRQLAGRLWIDANEAGQGTRVSFSMRASSPRTGAGRSSDLSGQPPASL
jgi:signal transduction histidine kinase